MEETASRSETASVDVVLLVVVADVGKSSEETVGTG